MANKKYKMTVSLSDGSTVDAGTFIAPQGPKGDTGAQGPKGDTGAQGPKGDTGAQGPKGDTGAQGPQGVKGDTGAQGPKGDTGAQGPQGIQGPQGPEGPAGPAGVIGNWVSIGESNFTADINSVYIIRFDGYDGDTALLSTRTVLTTTVSFFTVSSDTVTITHYIMNSSGKFSKKRIVKIQNGSVTFQELTPSSAKDILYIKLK